MMVRAFRLNLEYIGDDMRMRVTTEMLLAPEHGEGITQRRLDEVAAIIGEELLHVPETGFVVMPFSDAPQPLREVFSWNGGDEDWLVVTRNETEVGWLPSWIGHTDSCEEPDIYVLDGFVVYVGSHA
jgi:hypothetical protein